MADTKYVVEIEVNSTGDFESKIPGAMAGATKGAAAFESKLGSLHQGLSQLAGTARSVGSTMMAPFDMVASKVADITVGLAKMGFAAGVGAITYGVVSLNGELEKTQISIASIMNANGMNSGGIMGGMALAGEQMTKMRKDAASLPGEFMDLANIMRTAMIPAAHAGLGPDAIRELSAKTMAAGAVSGLPMDMVAREMAQLMEGRAGAHNVLGMRLMGLSGSNAEKFNKSSSQDRAKEISVALDKFAPSIELFKNSWEGLSSTFVDNIKRFGGMATEPLFEKLKDTLKDVNKWFDENENRLTTTAQAWGSKLVWAFDQGKAALEEWWPIISTFADNFATKFGGIWKDIAPVVHEVVDALKEFLKSPDAPDKIMSAAKMYAGAKGTGAVLGGVADVGLGAMGLMSTLKMLGVGGGGAAAAAKGGAALASGGAWAAQSATTMGAMTTGSSMAAGEFAAMTGATGVASAGILATVTALSAFAAMLAGVGLAGWQAYELYNDIASDQQKTADAILRAGLDTVAALELVNGAFDYQNEGYQAMMQKLIVSGDDFEASVLMMAAAAKEAAAQLLSIKNKENAATGAYWSGFMTDVTTADNAAFLAKTGAHDPKNKQGAGGKHPGGGGTNIAKIEIVVTGNESPSRTARLVMAELQNLQRHPKVSRDVPNYSAP